MYVCTYVCMYVKGTWYLFEISDEQPHLFYMGVPTLSPVPGGVPALQATSRAHVSYFPTSLLETFQP